CDHVVTGASTVTVKLADGTSYQAAIVGEDSQTDIAVLKIEAKTALTAAVIGDSESLIVGQTAIAIGNPLGSLGGTATSGIISALDREVTIDNQNYNLLQTNAAINPGNSGGGLFNINGELIGIVNAKSSGSSSTTTIEGLGFAIPINNAKKVAEQLISYGYVQGRVMLGVYVYEVTSSTSSYELRQSQYSDLLNYITDYGVYFINYQSGIEGDMMFGDRVVAIDGITVSSKADITNILEDYSVGDKITVTVARLQENGRSTQSKMIEVELTLVENVPAALDNSANG
ncbi:MAG: trypsin-like peptidase domain-containing protein, partial [Eubacteriales bacterium]